MEELPHHQYREHVKEVVLVSISLSFPEDSNAKHTGFWRLLLLGREYEKHCAKHCIHALAGFNFSLDFSLSRMQTCVCMDSGIVAFEMSMETGLCDMTRWKLEDGIRVQSLIEN